SDSLPSPSLVASEGSEEAEGGEATAEGGEATQSAETTEGAALPEEGTGAAEGVEAVEGAEAPPAEGTEATEGTDATEGTEAMEGTPVAGNYEALLEEAMGTRNRRRRAEKLREAIAVNPQGVAALDELGWNLTQRNQYAEAGAFAERAVAIDPTLSRSWLVLGNARQQAGDRDGARAAYDACVEQGQGRSVRDCRAMR
ncbi:MAG: hypothetical protein AAF645_12375, partial [Myxococcota bacterium]